MVAQAFAPPRLRILDSSGDPVPGAKINFYIGGTTTRQDTYTTKALSVAHANPVVCDAGGEYDAIYLDAEKTYRVIVTDSADVTLYDEDNINDVSFRAPYYAQTTAESAAGFTPTDYTKEPGDVDRANVNADGVTDDSTAFDGIESVEYGITRIPKASYSIQAVVEFSNTLLRGGHGSVLKGTTATDTLEATTHLQVDTLEFDTHNYAIQNQQTADPSIEFSVRWSEFHSGDNIPIWINCPITYANVICNYFHTGEGQQTRFGTDTYSLQSGWNAPVFAFNHVANLTATANASMAACLSYGPYTKIIGNHARSLTGHASNETWFYYVKSPHGIVGLNTGAGIQTGTSIYGINLKGTARGTTATPNGYGALAIGNQLVGSDEGTALQMEVEEQALIGNAAEAFDYGIEQGSGDASGNRAIANRLRGNATASTYGHGASGISGSKWFSSLNMYYNYADGTIVAISGTDTFDLTHQSDEIILGASNAAGRGVDYTCNTTGNLTNVLISNLQVKTFLDGMRVDGSDGVIISNIQFDDIGNAPIYYDFTDSTNIVGRNALVVTQATTGATATTVFRFPLYTAGQRARIRMVATLTDDGTDYARLVRECVAANNAGTVTIAESSAVDAIGTTTGKTASIQFAVSSTTVACQVVGIAVTNINWIVSFDFDLLQ